MQGFLLALKEVMPYGHLRNYVMHIWKIFIKQYKDKQTRGIVWECAKCTTEAEFKVCMDRLKRVNDNA